ncbi:hypothetical protein K491DRAFT_784748 [Lophiostoma macrostomum CBS 122681]|uniref:Uncharacterized protein n=1 Tax=Lophiostoma macrostomum CBS 122681 TaxID=1314788 RepID=A0A6A6SK83_9PLEO|nr:hypothetical protein K491DRAFT_784748 [Lophiostoma macrostomum CBS 122681]
MADSGTGTVLDFDPLANVSFAIIEQFNGLLAFAAEIGGYEYERISVLNQPHVEVASPAHLVPIDPALTQGPPKVLSDIVGVPRGAQPSLDAEWFKPNGVDLLLAGGVLQQFANHLVRADLKTVQILAAISQEVEEPSRHDGYWLENPQGARQLIAGWIGVFKRQRFLIKFAPTTVQMAFHAVEAAETAATKRPLRDEDPESTEMTTARKRRRVTGDYEDGTGSKEPFQRHPAAPSVGGTLSRAAWTGLPGSRGCNTRNKQRNAGFACSPGRIAMWHYNHPGISLPYDAGTGWESELEALCTPPSVDITFLGNTPITAVEIMTFFPLHAKWHWIHHRLNQNGWTDTHIAHYVMWSRRIKDPLAFQRSTLAKRLQSTRKWEEQNQMADAPVSKFDMQGIMMDRGLSGIHTILEDYRLVDLADGVAHMPNGDDRRLLSTVVEHANINGNGDARLSQFQAYVRDHGLNQIYFPPMLHDSLYMYPDAQDHFGSSRLVEGPRMGANMLLATGYQPNRVAAPRFSVPLTVALAKDFTTLRRTAARPNYVIGRDPELDDPSLRPESPPVGINLWFLERNCVSLSYPWIKYHDWHRDALDRAPEYIQRVFWATKARLTVRPG